MIALYTDVTLIFAKDDATIDSIIQNLSKNFNLEDQGYVSDFLGISISIQNNQDTKTINIS